MNVHAPSEPMTPEALEAALRAIGPVRYHDLHPFHGLLHDGKLNKGQVQAWALNRFVYQSAIPRKDASLIARCEDRELRREWVHRITDHDGSGDDKGGIERWLILTEGLGLDRELGRRQRAFLRDHVIAIKPQSLGENEPALDAPLVFA